MCAFKSSINVQFDLDDSTILDRYILTPSHADIFKGIMGSIETPRGIHSHLITGPYGTGKSLLSTILCRLVTRNIAEQSFQRLYEQALRIDSHLAQRFEQFNESDDFRFIPVLINGKRGSLRNIINVAVHQALIRHDIHIYSPNEAKSVLNAVQRWESAYPNTFKQFLQHLKNKNIDYTQWLKSIEVYDETIIQDFKEVYPQLTSGSLFTIEHEDSFAEHLNTILIELQKQKVGLFLIYDEFGRFLQSLHENEIVSNMQDLQDLAELANSKENFHLLFISHKHIRQYAGGQKETLRLEFEKVEKRFRSYHVETDTLTYLSLAHEALAETNQKATEHNKPISIVQVHPFMIFSELSASQLEEYVIKGMYPLHPVAVYLLPYLSSMLGQNERTLFSFLEDEEKYGLRYHVENNEGYYYADKLFYYFIHTNESETHPTIKLFQKLAAYIPEDEGEQRRILVFVSLWTTAGLVTKQPLSTQFIAFALGFSHERTELHLHDLQKRKVIRWNRVNGQWELFDGSSFDVDSLISEKMVMAPVTTERKLEILQNNLEKRYILANEYNDQKSMIRYAEIQLIWSREINEELEQFSFQSKADNYILYILLEQDDDITRVRTVLEQLKSDLGIFVIPEFRIIEIEETVSQLHAIELLIQDHELLAIDPRLKQELSIRLNEVKEEVRHFLGQYNLFSSNLYWYSGSKCIEMRSELDLEIELSERMLATYPETPEIRNEAFNRHKVSSVQKRAAIDVINRLIHNVEKEQFGIEGFGPNYLIYASVLKNHGYKYDSDQNLIRMSPAYENLRGQLIEFLHEQPDGCVSDLIHCFKRPPFGIRQSVIPVLFIALLRDYWDQILFYTYDMHVSNLDGASVFELVERCEEYRYKFLRITLEQKELINNIGHVFDLPEEHKSTYLSTVDALLKWLRSKPKFTQTTQQLSEEACHLKNIIRIGEVDPYRCIQELVERRMDLFSAKVEIEDFMIMNEILLCQQLLEISNCGTINELIQAIQNRKVELIGLQSKLTTAQVLEDNFLDVLSMHIVGVARSEWSDATQELFIKQFKHEWNILEAQSSLEVAAGMGIVNQVEPIALSKKSQLLYTNIKNMVKYAGKDVAENEIKYLLYKLLQEV